MVIGVVREHIGLEGVAAVLRNQVQLHAAELAFGAAAAELDIDFVGVRRVDVEAAPRPLGGVVAHAVLQQPLFALRPAVNHHPERLLAFVAADVLEVRRNHDTRRERPVGRDALVGRQGVEHFAREHTVLNDVVDVDGRSGARDRDRLFDRAHLHVGIERRHEPGRELDAVAPDSIEPGQRERHGVHARQQIDDLVLPLTVGRRRSHFLDERRARCLDRHTRQDRSGRVLDHSGDTAAGLLCRCAQWVEKQASDDEDADDVPRFHGPSCPADMSVPSGADGRASLSPSPTRALAINTAFRASRSICSRDADASPRFFTVNSPGAVHPAEKRRHQVVNTEGGATERVARIRS